MAGFFSYILLYFSISLIYMVSNSPFCSISLNSGFPSSFVTLVSIFNRGNTDPFGEGGVDIGGVCLFFCIYQS